MKIYTDAMEIGELKKIKLLVLLGSICRLNILPDDGDTSFSAIRFLAAGERQWLGRASQPLLRGGVWAVPWSGALPRRRLKS